MWPKRAWSRFLIDIQSFVQNFLAKKMAETFLGDQMNRATNNLAKLFLHIYNIEKAWNVISIKFNQEIHIAFWPKLWG